MKSNLRRKLFMSLAATAACAATLTSTTFAWYTQNDTVTTESVNAVTESSIDTGSIYISAGSTYSAGTDAVAYDDFEDYNTVNGTTLTEEQYNALTDEQKIKTPAVAKKTATTWSMYKSSAEPVLVNSKSTNGTWDNSGSTPVYSGTTLIPVYYDGTNYKPMKSVVDKYTQATGQATESNKNSFYEKNGDVYTLKTGIAAGDNVSSYYTKTPMGDVTYEAESADNQMEFVYRLRTANAGVAKTVYFKDFSIQNTTEGATFPSQTALVSGTGTGIVNAGSYSVDLLSALKMTISITTVSTEEGKNNQPATAAATSTVYNFKAWATHNNNVDVSGTNGNAIGYYNTALGTNIAAPDNYSEGTALKKTGSTQLSFEIPTTGYVEIRFVFWLDGWDSYCYDTCRQQSFKFSTNFTTSAYANNNYVPVYTA